MITKGCGLVQQVYKNITDRRLQMINKIKQLLCNHKKVSPHKKVQKFSNIQGQTVYYICDKCNKVISEEFLNNENYYNSYK